MAAARDRPFPRRATLRVFEGVRFESTQQVKKAEIGDFAILTGPWFAMVSRGRGAQDALCAPPRTTPMQEFACQRHLRDA
jgi:hypothetical protein